MVRWQDDFGGLILTNLGGGGQDIFLAKYDSTGALQWARRAGGNSPNRDAGRGIGVDTNGNIYVAGGFYGPADFGSFSLPGDQNEEFFLVKYNGAGTVQWVQQSVDAHANAYGTGLAVDGAGNCYAVGFADGGWPVMFGTTNLPNPSTNGYSTFLVKYDNTGTLKWAQLIGGPGQTYADKVAVDSGGNVYLYGSFTQNTTIGTSNLIAAGSTKNVFFAKFDTLGNLIWVQQPQGDVGKLAGGGVTIDQAGSVYVSGMFSTMALNFGGIRLTNAGSSDEAFVAKYDGSGAIQWARQTSGTSFDAYLDVTLDSQSNVFAAGILSSNAAVAKYDPAGMFQWASSGSGPPANPASSIVEKCAVDSAGNCYLAGWYQGTATFGTNVLQPQGYWNFFLAKVAQYTFGTQIQTANSSSISFESGLFTYTDSNASDAGEEHAILPLFGAAASAINSTGAWTASISANLSARTFTAGTSHAELGFVVSTNLSGGLGSDGFVFELAQENNTGDGDGGSTDIYPDGWYGTALSFQALVNGSRDPVTPLGMSQATGNGSVYLLLSGGTASAGAAESIGSASGTLTITYDPSNKTVVGTYNGTNVAKYSIAGWGSNPPLALGVWGGSGKLLAVPSGTATASNFSAAITEPPVIFSTPHLTADNNYFTFQLSGPVGSNYVLQSSSNLLNWIPVSTSAIPVSGTITLSNAISGYNQRFYRAHLQ